MELMRVIVAKLEGEGYILRAGAAKGADSAFESGLVDKRNSEIYIPWKGFGGRCDGDAGVVLASNLNNWGVALEMVKEVHPAPHLLKEWSMALHGRNMYQVLGRDLNTKSSFVILWSKPTENGVEGGTNTAYQLAKKNGINVYNLYNEDVQERFIKWLNK